MKNKEAYQKTLNEAAPIRLHVNELHKQMGELSKLFSKVFEEDRRVFILIKDMIYYGGGYPSENTPPRIESLMNKFIATYKYFKFIGQAEQIETYMNKAGIEINLKAPNSIKDLPINFDKLKENKGISLAAKLFPNNDMPQTTKKLLDELLARGQLLQEEICEQADIIKEEKAAEVEMNCSIKKPHFFEAVHVKCKQLLNKSIHQDLQKVEANLVSQEDAVSVFK